MNDLIANELVGKADLIQLVCWLSSMVTKLADCRHNAIALPSEECKDYVTMQFPIVQGHKLQQAIRQLGEQPTNDDSLRRAIEYLQTRIKDEGETAKKPHA